MYTLPTGHPSGARGSGGAKAESEVESATTSDSAEDHAPKKTTRKRVKAEAEQVQPPEKETVEVDSTGSAKDPTKPEE